MRHHPQKVFFRQVGVLLGGKGVGDAGFEIKGRGDNTKL